MPERLNRYLASTGLGSRRAVEQLIRDGRVTLNGAPAALGDQVEPGDDVRVDGTPVQPERPLVVLFHKPAGLITTASDPQGRPTVVDAVQSDVRLFPVGRLDAATTGALLLTNDGDLAHRLMHPRHEFAKTYIATVAEPVGAAALQKLRDGTELADGMTAPAQVEALAPTRIQISIHEGRNRQVRRMFEAVGHPVRELHRNRYGSLTLEGLAPGEWRVVEGAELEALRREA